MKNGLVFSQSGVRNFSCILLHADTEWNFGSSYRRIHTDPANSNRKGKWEVCKHAKRQKAKKALDYLSCSPYISFVFQLLAAALQQNKASLFLNVTHLILKGGDSRLKLLSFEIFVVPGQIEANFHYFTSYPHCSSEKWNTSDDEVKNISLLFLISDDPFFLETNDWRQILCRRHLTEHSMRINVCSLECDLTKHYPSS